VFCARQAEAVLLHCGLHPPHAYCRWLRAYGELPGSHGSTAGSTGLPGSADGAGPSGQQAESSNAAEPRRFVLRRVSLPTEDASGKGGGSVAGPATSSSSVSATGPVGERGGTAAGGGSSDEDYEIVSGADVLSGGDSGEEDDEGLREANEFLRRMRMQAEGGEASGNSGTGPSSSAGAAGAAVSRGPGGGRRSAGARGSSKASAREPLQWFGVLVPQSLRDAQAQFMTGRFGCLPGSCLTCRGRARSRVCSQRRSCQQPTARHAEH
jgi:hypothetical protein